MQFHFNTVEIYSVCSGISIFILSSSCKACPKSANALLLGGMLRLMMYHSGIQIPYQTEIGEGIKFGHWGTIVINERAKIGKNLSISHGCVIGNSQGKRKGFPIIGNNLVMNANSIIAGGIHIGNNVLIAPGAFCNFDVPDNSIVIGNPGKIIPRDSSPTEKYIVYPVEDYRG